MAMMEQDEVRMYEVLGFTLSKVVLSKSKVLGFLTFKGSFELLNEQEWLYSPVPALCPSFAQPEVEH